MPFIPESSALRLTAFLEKVIWLYLADFKFYFCLWCCLMVMFHHFVSMCEFFFPLLHFSSEFMSHVLHYNYDYLIRKSNSFSYIL